MSDAAVHYECQRCTNCCRWPGFVKVDGADITAIAGHLGLTEDDFIQRYTRLRPQRDGLALIDKANGECVFLEGRDCAVQAVKPGQCRGFPNAWNFPGWREVCEAVPTMIPKISLFLLFTLSAAGLQAVEPSPAGADTRHPNAGTRRAPATAEYGARAVSSIDERIAGKTPSAETRNFFSVYDGATHTFKRNPSCVFPWPSCVSCWNSANADGTGGNRGCITMITPTEGVTNQHFAQPYAAGVVHYFVGTDGVSYPLTVASSRPVDSMDIQVIRFKTAAPAAVGFAPVFDAGVPRRSFPAGTPLLTTDQHKEVVVIELASATDPASELVVRTATATHRAAWSAAGPAVLGDSDSPIFVLIGDRAVLLSSYHFSVAGPQYSEARSAINALLPSKHAMSIYGVDPPP